MKVQINQILGILLILIGIWAFSPWLKPIPASIVRVPGVVEVVDIPPYNATRMGIGVVLLVAGAAIFGKIPF